MFDLRLTTTLQLNLSRCLYTYNVTESIDSYYALVCDWFDKTVDTQKKNTNTELTIRSSRMV